MKIDKPELPPKKSGLPALTKSNEKLLFIISQCLVLVIFIPIGLFFEQLWLTILALPVIFLLNLGWSFMRKTIAGFLIFSNLAGISTATFILFIPDAIMPLRLRIGLAVAAIGISWIVFWYGSKQIKGKYWWWSFLPGSILLSGSMLIAISGLEFLDFIFFLGGGVGLGLLVWGIGDRLLGLIIAGSITTTTAPGVAFSFRYFMPGTVLSQTGILLIWLAVGWGLITVASRVVNEKYLWWPLIPASIIAVVGLGLYFGGDPVIGSALLSNSSALGVVIFAGYLILFRTRFGK